MKRKIKLYIAGQLADITDQTLVLFNYTQEDAANPTAVVAPYSQQITLPGTARNNTIFGDIWRPDRTTSADGSWTGTGFDPLKKTPFEIYADTGEILEAGYIRLDEITRNRRRIAYKATLFGGLGSFFYALSYNQDGSQMTLADLEYFEGPSAPANISFNITAANVLAAWANLGDWSDPLWNVVNFAPTYQGYPDGDFDPKKGIVTPALVGLTAPIGSHDVKGGKALVNLPSNVDEWAAKDLRSYLQRPVINFGHVLRAIKRKAEANGYTFDISTLATDMGYYGVVDTNRCSALWLTLPKLSALAPSDIEDATLTKSDYTGRTSGQSLATWTIGGGPFPSGTKIQLNVAVKMTMTSHDAMTYPGFVESPNNMRSEMVSFFQLVGYSSGVEVARGKILTFGNYFEEKGLSPKQAYNLLYKYNHGTDSALKDEDFAQGVAPSSLTLIDSTHVRVDNELPFSIEAYDIDEVKLECLGCAWIKRGYDWGEDMKVYYVFDIYDTSAFPRIFTKANIDATHTDVDAIDSNVGVSSDTLSTTGASTVRSGALITQQILLGGTNTPAQYLLSFAKTLGLYFVVDPATQQVTLCKRAEFFNGGTIDLTKRIDRRSISIKPLAVDSKWYVFEDETRGEFADEYEKTYKATYGSKKINTGYEFNDDTKDILSSSILKGAVTALERSKYFNWLEDSVNGNFIPSVFLDEKVSYSLWDSEGQNLDTDIPIPAANTTTLTYYNTNQGLEGYDIEFANKLQLHDASGKAVDGEDILVFYEGVDTYEYFKVSDDDSTMYNITGGKACWDLDPGDPDGLGVPSFQRYKWRGGNYHVDSSFDYGEPRELAFPRQIYADGDTRALYARAWRAYLTDRYDGDTKVMTCKVDLAGLRVDAGLLRNFYWYEGALWVLNKIKNYSMTTHAPTDCEFVQVQDKDNYTNGQNFSI